MTRDEAENKFIADLKAAGIKLDSYIDFRNQRQWSESTGWIDWHPPIGESNAPSK